MYVCVSLTVTLFLLGRARTTSATVGSPYNETAPYGAVPNNVSTSSIVLTGFNECDKWQQRYKPGSPPGKWRQYIKDGFMEQSTMVGGEWKQAASRDKKWVYPDVDWTSAAAIEFFGPAW